MGKIDDQQAFYAVRKIKVAVNKKMENKP